MTLEVTLVRLRRFLFTMAAAAFIGTIVELLLAEHFDQALQLIPFLLCAAGLAALALAAYRPGRATLRGLRLTMVLVALGTLLGIRQHLEANAEVFNEVRAGAPFLEALWGVVSGAAPLLAPGILALAAALAVAATYQHPALQQERR